MCNNLKCKFCGTNRINKRGKQKYNGKQRYLCREAQSPTDASLLAIGSLSLGEVPKRLKGARSTKARGCKLACNHQRSTKPNRNKLA